MSFILSFLISAICLLALIPVIFFIVECIGAALPRHRSSAQSEPFTGTVAIIIPAHNEGTSLCPTLENLLAVRPALTRIVVVADNCQDETAQIARDCFKGHEATNVIERTDHAKRGKGYALEFGLNYLREQPVDIVVFVDADCQLTEDCLPLIINEAHRTGRPAQALYMMAAPKEASPRQSVAAFAWMVMNKIRMRGLYRLFDVTRLTGSGMAFPFPLLRDHFTGTGNIVEDLGLTITLVQSGNAPVFVADALVTSTLPSHDAAAITQRARWEHGSLSMMRQNAGTLLRDGMRKLDLRTIAMALDLMIPPLTLLLAGLGLAVIVLTPFALFGLNFPLILVVMTGTGFAMTLMLVWFFTGRAILPPAALGGLVAFLGQKLKIYGRPGRESAKGWTRTDRD